MPNVDFTLEDVRNMFINGIKDDLVEDVRVAVTTDIRTAVIEDVRTIVVEDIRKTLREDMQTIVDSSIAASEQRLTKHMDVRFEEAHEATIDLVGTILDQLDEHNARFDQMDAHFEQLEGELKTTNRLVRKHAVDIMELRSAN